MTLTEFLFARIAADERRAEQLKRIAAEEGSAAAHWALTDEARHLLANCEAKRRIVEDRSFRESQNPARLSIFGERILGLLALPYADHPDYRQEWKP